MALARRFKKPSPVKEVAEPKTKPVRFVARDDRRKGWPVMSEKLVDTRYVAKGLRVVAMSTLCGDIEVGWSTCGRCGQHITNCRCRGGVTPPRGVVYVYRARNKLPYPHGAVGYIGLHPDPRTNKGDVFVPSPNNPVIDDDAEPTPKKKVIRRIKKKK